MQSRPTVRFYLRDGLRQRVEERRHTFFNRLLVVLDRARFHIKYSDDSRDEKLKFADSGQYSVQLMQEAYDDRGVTVRKNYFGPFWHIETTAERWKRPVVFAKFNDSKQPHDRASRFSNHWRRSLFPTVSESVASAGYVYVPLQGRLLKHRSFQSCSPIQMVEALLEHERKRRIILTLHPGEMYSAKEQYALTKIVERNERVSISTGRMNEYLPKCDYVVTQNSSAGIFGYLMRKPLILIGATAFSILRQTFCN